jgi:hypothetical protein
LKQVRHWALSGIATSRTRKILPLMFYTVKFQLMSLLPVYGPSFSDNCSLSASLVRALPMNNFITKMQP